MILAAAAPAAGETGDAWRVDLVGRWANGPCEDVVAQGGVAYFGNGGYLQIVDYMSPPGPVELKRVLMPSVVRGVCKSGNHVYAAVGRDGIRVVDVTNPSTAFIAGGYAGTGVIDDVVVYGGYAYLVDVDGDLVILDVANPAASFETGRFRDPFLRPWGVAVSGDYAYVAAGTGGIICVNVANKSAPYNSGIYSTNDQALGVTAFGKYLYVADWVAGLTVFDISDPYSVVEVGSFDTGSAALAVDVFAGHAYVADGAGGMRIVDAGGLYHYQLGVVRPGGGEVRSSVVTVRVPSGRFLLHQNCPNPFRGATALSFELPAPARAQLSVYDPQGRLVRRLVDAHLPAGPAQFEWDGLDDRGTAVSSGVYFYSLHADKRTATRKLLLLR
jgi:hypothetical protein